MSRGSRRERSVGGVVAVVFDVALFSLALVEDLLVDDHPDGDHRNDGGNLELVLHGYSITRP